MFEYPLRCSAASVARTGSGSSFPRKTRVGEGGAGRVGRVAACVVGGAADFTRALTTKRQL
jgi:hypothetical protein